ncbi:MAG TPA: carbohydrate kinase family protein [Candidatus Limnocylindria bacterium]|jgi:sugar/nucleoside kinase (ribokinase family)
MVAPLIVVVGDAMLDITVRPALSPREGGDVPADIRLGPGGQGANVAVRLARHGLPVRLVCAIGDDAAGRIIRESLAASDVAINDIGAEASGAVIVMLGAGGERTMLSHRAPLGRRLSAEPLTRADWLIVSGYLLAERDRGVLEIAAGDIGRRVVLGCSLEQALAPAWADAAAALRPHLTILNDTEAATIAGAVDRPAVLSRRIADRLGGLVVVSHRSGAAIAIGDQEVEVEAASADMAVDTTGAGDALAARLVAALIDADWPPGVERVRPALASAIATAAEVARLAGAQARTSDEAGGTVRR